MNKILEIAEYYIENKSTMRKCAKYFGKSKSTIHHYLHNLLPHIDIESYKKVSAIAQLNFNEKHIRGGQATKIKYQKY